jgi:hypothetical protein
MFFTLAGAAYQAGFIMGRLMMIALIVLIIVAIVRKVRKK